MTTKVLLFLAAVALIAGALYSASTIQGYQQANAAYVQRVAELEAVDPEVEYYRGIYDMWRYFAVTSGRDVDALTLTGIAVGNDWYGQDSRGWRWPIED